MTRTNARAYVLKYLYAKEINPEGAEAFASSRYKPDDEGFYPLLSVRSAEWHKSNGNTSTG